MSETQFHLGDRQCYLIRVGAICDEFNSLTRVDLTGGSSPYTQGWTINSIGNITARTGTAAATYTYGDAAHVHAVTQIGSLYYCYDANGNITKRAATNNTAESIRLLTVQKIG